jgi:hypothetical protein
MQFMQNYPAIFFSLQYGSASRDIHLFSEALGDRFVFDPNIDQLQNMDDFASQLAAMDAIVTIINTGAHLAGAIGVPTLLIRDDWFRKGWPVLSESTPWYPSVTILGKEGTPWNHTFQKIRSRLEGSIKLDPS